MNNSVKAVSSTLKETKMNKTGPSPQSFQDTWIRLWASFFYFWYQTLSFQWERIPNSWKLTNHSPTLDTVRATWPRICQAWYSSSHHSDWLRDGHTTSTWPILVFSPPPHWLAQGYPYDLGLANHSVLFYLTNWLRDEQVIQDWLHSSRNFVRASVKLFFFSRIANCEKDIFLELLVVIVASTWREPAESEINTVKSRDKRQKVGGRQILNILWTP